MTRTHIATDAAPAALGPYSQGISTDHLVFCSGQVGLDPATGRLVGGFAAQVEQAIRNIGAVLAAAGLGFGDVVKTTLFLTEIGSFNQVNEVYRRFFVEPPPARSTIGVAELPAGAVFEIEAIAVRRTG